MKELDNCINEQSGSLRMAAIQVIVRLFEPGIVSYWTGACAINKVVDTPPANIGIEESIVLFWKVGTYVLNSVAKKILQYYPADGQANKALLLEIASMGAHLLYNRNKYLRQNEQYLSKSQMLPCRFGPGVNLEISELLLLNSNDIDFSRISVVSLNQMVFEAEFLKSPAEDMFPFVQNIDVYKQIREEFNSQYWSVTLSQKVHHKKVLSFMASFKLPTPGVIGAWEEIYKRWKITSNVLLNNISSNTGSQLSLSSIDDFKITNTKIEGGSKKDGVPSDWYNYTGFLISVANLYISCSVIYRDTKSSFQTNGQSDKLTLNTIHEKIMSLGVEDDGDDADTQGIKGVLSLKKYLYGYYAQSVDLVKRFVYEILGIIVSENVLVRETVKEICGYNMCEDMCGSNYLT
jgi:neurofibromin 1